MEWPITNKGPVFLYVYAFDTVNVGLTLSKKTSPFRHGQDRLYSPHWGTGSSSQEQSAPLLTALEAWLREQRARLSNSSSVAKPIDYMLRRWDRFTRSSSLVRG